MSCEPLDRTAYEQHIAERNRAIVEMRAAGATYELLAQHFALSRITIRKLAQAQNKCRSA
jgi:ribosomal protein S14